MKTSTSYFVFVIASVGFVFSAHAQFFNAPAMGVVMVIGQKRACSARFPELAKSLQAAFDTFVAKNSDVVREAVLRDMDKPTTLETSPVFAGVTQEECSALVQSMPSVSLRALMQEQELINEQRRKAERQ